MTDPLPARLATAVLLVALEPSAPRARLESALVLLGHRVDTLDDATAHGLVRASGGDRFEVSDPRVARVVAQGATDRERRLAHLALACSRARRTMGYDARAVFDLLSAALDGPVPLPRTEPDGPRIPHTGPAGHESTGRGTTPVSTALTPRERTVAQLAASGLPTREIASASYLSPKTVEYHLTRVYRKLGVRSKAELVFALAGGPVMTGH